MHFVLKHLPAAVVCLVFVICCLLIVNTGLMLFNRSALKKLREEKHESLAIMFGAISLIYSLILAFVIITDWQDYDELSDSVEQESNQLRLILNHSAMLPDSLSVPIKKAVHVYAQYVLEQEWSQSDTPMSPDPLFEIYNVFYRLHPATVQQKEILTNLYDELNETFEFRRERLYHRSSHVPGFVWLILLTGSIITIMFTFFFEITSTRLQSFFISLFTIMIAMCLFLVYVLDHPFEGSTAVSNEQYEIISNQSK